MVGLIGEFEHDYLEPSAAVEAAKIANLALADDNADLSGQVQALGHDLERSAATNAGLAAANHAQAHDLAALGEANSALEEESRRMHSRIETLDRDLERAGTQNTALTGELQEVKAAHSALLSQTGNIDRLETRARSLRTETAELEAKRRPLLLQSSMSYFRCTGSVEPKITCLDSATFLDNFRPEDVVVGTVISFQPTGSCSVEGESVVHRVMGVKVENGVYYYRPKGDANRQDDGCWVPESNVDGYLIEIHKNTEPQNRELRSLVNAASREADEARTRYVEKFRAYCGFAPTSGRTCYLSGVRYDEVLRLADAYNRAADYHRCWVNTARNASRSLMGRQPVFLHCLKLPPSP